jgi:hypothetical protein
MGPFSNFSGTYRFLSLKNLMDKSYSSLYHFEEYGPLWQVSLCWLLCMLLIFLWRDYLYAVDS